MALFQKTVEQKYLKQLDSELINAKYIEFKTYFGNPDIQENIRNSKEEQYQEGFLRELFVKILGYKLNPTSNFNLTTEYKNIKDSKKADGAIIVTREHAPSVIAVIELKGTNTTDLSKVESQAFGYKNNQPDCMYVVTSNFEKIRFYIDNAIEHVEFNLFTLTKIDFEILYLCLSFESIKNGLPKKVKDESLSQEDVITKQLYKDYSLFKRELHQNLVSLNQQYDSLTLFKKSQKLLDRFLFLFFAEDRNLLPPNSVHLVLTDWRDLQERDVEIPLYQRFKKYFEYLNTGYKGKRYDVFAYNGGLFKPDEVLDNILIDDELLFRHTYKLSDYDFASEIDVNILGHIFENSLNELDELSTREHAPSSKEKNSLSRRKKDGVFYTPKYITKYIVENTVGKLCTEKKDELQLIEEDYTTDRKRQQKTKQALLEKLKTYQNWLLQLTICDPACGSGAFLNQALDFLISEHRYIDELQAKLLGVPLLIGDVEKGILENNLFGVDLNEESVEIAKLSLWLRTAQPNRKLNDLSNNIKCGNSLIDDPAVAGDKAFNWHEAFPQVFEKKDKKGWHITCATHNSRYSQRMLDNHVEWGDAVWLSEKEEKIVIETIAKIAKEDNLNIIACNVCGDHLHLLLVCEEQDVPKIVGKLKSISARACNIEMGRTISGTRGHAPLSTEIENSPDSDTNAPLSSSPEAPLSRGTAQAHLWTQKFGCKEITSEEQLENTIAYIRNNRVKHGLPELGSSSDGSRGSSNKGACSLVNTMCCSVEHAFRPEYTGGFDVVIGNPPYVNISTMPEIHNYLKENYSEIHTGYNDLMYYFMNKGLSILNQEGIYGVITSNYFIGNDYAGKLRLFLNRYIEQLVNFEKTLIFEDANVHTVIVFAKKNSNVPIVRFYTYTDNISLVIVDTNKGYSICEMERMDLTDKWLIADNSNKQIINKLHINSTLSGDICDIAKGSESGKNEIFTITFATTNLFNIEKQVLRKCVKNSDISRYHLNEGDSYLIYSDNDFTEMLYPNAYKYLEQHKDLLLDRRGPKTNEYEWWRLHRPSIKEVFDANEKLLVPYRANKNRFAYDNHQFFNNGGDIRAIIMKLDVQFSIKYLLALLNAKLLDWFYGFIGKLKGDSREYFNKPLSEIPIKNISIPEQRPFIEKADVMLSLNKELQETVQKFQRSLQRKFNLEELPGKLQDWYLLTYADFIKELGKKKVKLSLSEEAEWEDYFIQESGKALSIKNQIDSTDKEIDQMVYQLYGLTDEEIAIVEGA